MVACTAETSSPSVRQPRPSPTFECPNQSRTVEDDGALVGEPTESDVDGDGNLDELSINLDRGGEPGCQAFLVLDTNDGQVSLPVWQVGAEGGLPQPSVRAVVDVDGDGVREIVVDEATGASTQFVALYAVVGDGLVWVEGPEDQQGLFPYGGSVGHLEAVDCSEDGDVVVASATPAPGRSAQEHQLYRVERRRFTLVDGRLKPNGSETHTIPIEELERFPEYRSTPFGDCPAN